MHIAETGDRVELRSRRRHPGGELRYASVDHERWPLHEAEVAIERNQVFGANGFAHPGSDPVSLYSPGVETVASGSERA